MDLENMVVELAQTAKKAARRLATTPTQTKEHSSEQPNCYGNRQEPC